MRLGIPSLARFDRDLLPENLNSLGIDLSSIPSVMPESIQKMPQAEPGTPTWWQAAGYTSANDAIMSGNFTYDMNKGWQLKPGAVTPAMKEIAAKSTPPTRDTSSFKPLSNVVSTDLGPLGTSGMSVFEDEPITMASDSTSPMSPMVEPEATLMDVDKIIEAAVEAAVGNGQPTTDDTILDKDAMEDKVYLSYSGSDEGGNYIVANGKKTYIPDFSLIDTGTETTTGTTDTDTGTETQQPDFMTQLQELIAQMQAEQTAAAEQAAAAEAERQKQAAEMTQNYMVGQPAVGYNPYESGQYQNNPYGAAGVPDMGGITTIPVPAAYNPNPYPIGGTT